MTYDETQKAEKELGLGYGILRHSDKTKVILKDIKEAIEKNSPGYSVSFLDCGSNQLQICLSTKEGDFIKSYFIARDAVGDNKHVLHVEPGSFVSAGQAVYACVKFLEDRARVLATIAENKRLSAYFEKNGCD